MKKSLIILLITTALCGYSYTQVTEKEKELKTVSKDSLEGWNTGGIVSLNFSQVSLTNWSAGGQNSISGNGLFSYFANLTKTKSSWTNSIDMGYGLLKQGKEDGMIKTDDRINISSKYGNKIYKNLYYAGIIDFKTQMSPGYNYPNDSVKISDFLSPAYLLGALGLDYKKSSNFSLFAAPITMKLTIVNNTMLADAGAFGVDPAIYDEIGNKISSGKKTRMEFGGYLRILWRQNLMENISLQSKIDLFSNYLHNPLNIDVSWEALITMKINKYITATLNTHLMYDDDINIDIDTDDDGSFDENRPAIQFKEILGIGFSYKF